MDPTIPTDSTGALARLVATYPTLSTVFVIGCGVVGVVGVVCTNLLAAGIVDPASKAGKAADFFSRLGPLAFSVVRRKP